MKSDFESPTYWTDGNINSGWYRCPFFSKSHQYLESLMQSQTSHPVWPLLTSSLFKLVLVPWIKVSFCFQVVCEKNSIFAKAGTQCLGFNLHALLRYFRVVVLPLSRADKKQASPLIGSTFYLFLNMVDSLFHSLLIPKHISLFSLPLKSPIIISLMGQCREIK